MWSHIFPPKCIFLFALLLINVVLLIIILQKNGLRKLVILNWKFFKD